MSESAPGQKPPRRTQRERREGTVAKLIEATIVAISEVGYARASVQEICNRAGVSHGGLFRHFETRLDLIVAAGAAVGKRQIATFWELIGPSSEQRTDFVDTLRVIRELSRSSLNIVWYELLLAARTDNDLRERFVPTIESYSRALYDTALRIPVIAAQPEHIRRAAVFTGLHMLDGEAFVNSVFPQPELDEKRLHLIADFYESRVEPPRVGAAEA